MKSLMTRAIDLAQSRGVQYADVRVVGDRTETIDVKNGIVESLDYSESTGFGVRVLVDNAWGFASSRVLEPREIDRITDMAFEIARASATVRGEKVQLGPAVTSQGTYQTPYKFDPFSVSLEDKLNLLMAADADMALEQGLRVRKGHLTSIRELKYFANSEGGGCGAERGLPVFSPSRALPPGS